MFWGNFMVNLIVAISRVEPVTTFSFSTEGGVKNEKSTTTLSSLTGFASEATKTLSFLTGFASEASKTEVF